MGEASPVARAERIVALDVIRGLALLGVLLMNNQDHFRGPAEVYAFSPHPWPGLADVLTDWVLALFFESKSVTLFSLLFGAGLAIQLERAAVRGSDFSRTAARRLGALLLFGALHVLVFWWGDILHVYAVLGFVLVPFLRRAPRTLLVWGTIFTLLPWLAFTGYTLLRLGVPLPPFNPGAAVGAFAEATRAYTQEGWVAGAGFRLRDWLEHQRLLPTLRFASYGLGLFLLGAAAWRHGVLRHPERHTRWLRRLVAIALPVGLALTAAALIRWNLLPYEPTRLSRWLTLTRYLLAPPLMAFGYGAALLLVLADHRWRLRLAPLAYAGRMALTCYLMQSVVMTWIYNGYGGGLYGELGPAAAATLAVLVFAAQVWFARWWLARFSHGPVEYVWRVLTYGRRQTAAAAA
jgi:uncharacterized protein